MRTIGNSCSARMAHWTKTAGRHYKRESWRSEEAPEGGCRESRETGRPARQAINDDMIDISKYFPRDDARQARLDISRSYLRSVPVIGSDIYSNVISLLRTKITCPENVSHRYTRSSPSLARPSPRRDLVVTRKLWSPLLSPLVSVHICIHVSERDINKKKFWSRKTAMWAERARVLQVGAVWKSYIT